MALNCWARPSISAALLLATVFSIAQPFGRFGYSPIALDAGFEITPTGFRARFPSADWFKFDTPFTTTRPVSIRSEEAIYLVSGPPAAVDKIRINVFAPGPEIYSESGFQFKVSSIAGPWLTFPGKGTVEHDLPSAPSRWVYVTFRDRQPGVMLVTPNEDTQWIVTGQSGDWRIETVKPYRGWLRLCLPTGVQPVQSFLDVIGRAAEKVEQSAPIYTAPYPGPVNMTAEPEDDGILVRWEAAAPLRVPVPLILARESGARYQVRSAIISTAGDLSDGPQWFTKENTLSAWFPVHPPGEGRAIAGRNGPWPDANDPAELPLRLLLGRAGVAEQAAAQQNLDDYLDSVEMFKEPMTGQMFPFGPKGEGLAEAANAAWIHQALGRVTGNTPNPYLEGLLWRVDQRNWTLSVDEPKIRANASAATSAAAALSEKPMDLAFAALLQAGLASESVLPVYARKRGIEPQPTERETPLIFLRAMLFDWASAIPSETSLERALFSPLRLLSSGAVETSVVGGDVTLTWNAEPGPVELLLGYPGSIRLIGTAKIENAETVVSPGRWLLKGTATESGPVSVTIRPTGAASPIPVWRVPGPR
ncbi:MAG: hypothetical protein KF812_01605 [Fimbriimonadaceae bacterium]|nr:hypothetical protein [Fimbriimonadaceae bacterium]